MGSCFNTVKFNASSEKEMKDKFSRYQEDLCSNHGNDTYAGHLGIVNGVSVASKSFPTENAAHEWICENTDKWDSAQAVRVGDFSKVFPCTASDKKINESYLELAERVSLWDSTIVTRVQKGKSTQRSCEHCGSKIAVKYIKSVNCPVCTSHKFLNTPTDEKNLQAVKLKLNSVTEKMNEAKKKYEVQAKSVFWLVGGWCAS